MLSKVCGETVEEMLGCRSWEKAKYEWSSVHSKGYWHIQGRGNDTYGQTAWMFLLQQEKRTLKLHISGVFSFTKFPLRGNNIVLCGCFCYHGFGIHLVLDLKLTPKLQLVPILAPCYQNAANIHLGRVGNRMHRKKNNFRSCLHLPVLNSFRSRCQIFLLNPEASSSFEPLFTANCGKYVSNVSSWIGKSNEQAWSYCCKVSC